MSWVGQLHGEIEIRSGSLEEVTTPHKALKETQSWTYVKEMSCYSMGHWLVREVIQDIFFPCLISLVKSVYFHQHHRVKRFRNLQRRFLNMEVSQLCMNCTLIRIKCGTLSHITYTKNESIIWSTPIYWKANWLVVSKVPLMMQYATH